jgi:hypothetical protein
MYKKYFPGEWFSGKLSTTYHNLLFTRPYFTRKKEKEIKNIPYLTLLVSPATIDFCVNLDRDFHNIVVSKLGQTSRAALLEQHDPATMSENTRKRIQKELMHAVFGTVNKLVLISRLFCFVCFFNTFLESLLVWIGILI